MKILFHATVCCLLALLCGCNPTFYLPNTQNVPMIKSNKEVNITVAGNGNQGELQGAFGVTDQLAIQLNGGLVFPRNEDNGNGGSGKFIEGGLGYYYNVGSSLLFDVYGLVGVGKMENHFPTTVSTFPGTTGKISAGLSRFSLQPSLSFHRRLWSVSGSARLSSLNFSNIKGSLTFDNQDQVAYLTDNKSNLLLEPALTLRVGVEKVKLQLQLVKSFNLSNRDFKQDDSLLSIGLNFRL